MSSAASVKAGHAYILIDAIDRTDKVLQHVQNKLNVLSSRFAYAGIGAKMLGVSLSIPIASAIRSASEFSDEILFLQSILGHTPEMMEPLVNKIKQVTREGSFMAADVARAAVALAQGGFKDKQIADSLGAVLNLARGARMELGPASDLLVDTLTLFEMHSSRANEVADKFFIAAKNGTIDVADLAQSFSYTALSAKNMGLSLDETLSALSTMSLRMLKSTKAGTSLNQLFESFAVNADKLRAIGVDPFKDGNPKDIVSVLTEIALATRRMTTEQREAALIDIFNVRGKRSAGALAAADAIHAISSSITEMSHKEGIAAEAAKTMDSGIGGAIRRILKEIDLLKIEMEPGLTNALKAVEKEILPIIHGLGIYLGRNQELVVILLKTIAGLFLYGAAMLAAAIATRILSTLIGILTIAFRILRATLVAATIVAAGLAIVIRGITIASTALWAITRTAMVVGYTLAAAAANLMIARLVALRAAIIATTIVQLLLNGSIYAALVIMSSWFHLFALGTAVVGGYFWLLTRNYKKTDEMGDSMQKATKSSRGLFDSFSRMVSIKGALKSFFSSIWSSLRDVASEIGASFTRSFKLLPAAWKMTWDKIYELMTAGDFDSIMTVVTESLKAQWDIMIMGMEMSWIDLLKAMTEAYAGFLIQLKGIDTTLQTFFDNLYEYGTNPISEIGGEEFNKRLALVKKMARQDYQRYGQEMASEMFGDQSELAKRKSDAELAQQARLASLKTLLEGIKAKEVNLVLPNGEGGTDARKPDLGGASPFLQEAAAATEVRSLVRGTLEATEAANKNQQISILTRIAVATENTVEALAKVPMGVTLGLAGIGPA